MATKTKKNVDDIATDVFYYVNFHIFIPLRRR